MPALSWLPRSDLGLLSALSSLARPGQGVA